MNPTPYLEHLGGSHVPVDVSDVAGLRITYDPEKKVYKTSRDEDAAPAVPPEPWRSAFIQPCAIPDMNHTGVRSPFLYQGPTYMRPDGTISAELRQGIQKKFMETPNFPVMDVKDMRRVDAEKSLRRSIALQKSAASVLGHGSNEIGMAGNGDALPPTDSLYSLGSDTSASINNGDDDSVMSGGTRSLVSTSTKGTASSSRGASKKYRSRGGKAKVRQRQKRLKKPFSTESLLNCLLDLEYGKTGNNFDQDTTFDWDIKDYIPRDPDEE